eukprot:758586-Prymnesium_polylepis.1
MARTVPAGSSMAAVCVTWDEYAYPPKALGLTSVRQPSSVAEMVWFCERGARSTSKKLETKLESVDGAWKATIMQPPAERAGADGGSGGGSGAIGGADGDDGEDGGDGGNGGEDCCDGRRELMLRGSSLPGCIR